MQMHDIPTQSAADVAAHYARRLRRGRRTWDFLARVVPGRLGERPGDPLRTLALQRLRPQPGEAVLDVGCGSGALLPPLSKAVGPAGRVVGVDASPAMLARSRRALTRAGTTGVELLRADAAGEPLGSGDFDAAVALASVSATPDPRRALENVYRALRPGGRFFVFDLRLRRDRGPRQILIRSSRWVYWFLAGFAGDDVLPLIQDVFDEVEVIGANDWLLLVLARKG